MTRSPTTIWLMPLESACYIDFACYIDLANPPSYFLVSEFGEDTLSHTCMP